MNPWVLGGWACGIVAQVAAIALLLGRGLGGRYPLAVLALCASVSKSAFMAYILATGGRAAYAAAWSQLQGVDVAVYALLTVQAVAAVAEHFPRGRRLAAATIGAFGLLSVGGILAMYDILSPRFTLAYEPAMRFARNADWACLLALVLNLGFHGIARVEWRTNATRFAAGVSMWLFLESVGMAVALLAKRDYWPALAGMMMILAAPVAGCAWFTRMNGAGDVLRVEEPAPKERARGVGA